MSHSAVSVIQILREQRLRVFLTSDVVTMTRTSQTAVVHMLQRLALQNIVVRIKRGVWVNLLAADFHPYEIVPFLRTPWPCYVSLHSALSDYGLVAEVPQVSYAVSAALPKKYSTPFGDFRIHHLPAHLVWGFEIKRVGQATYPIAIPEKAFLDLIYLALTPRSVLQFPQKRTTHWRLDKKRIKNYARRFDYPRLIKWLKQNQLWC